VARAKRTNRAEARRRYRAQVTDQANAEPTDGPPRPTEPTVRGSRVANEARPTGMRYAFRAAFRPPDFRDDIAHLPELLRSRAVFIPVLISIGTAAAIAVTNGTDVISRLLAQYFLVTPPIGSIFIAGFFAPRASYLAGLIAGLVAALALTAVVIATPIATSTAVPGASASPSAAASAATSASAVPSSSAAASPSAASPSAIASAAASPAGSGASAVPSPAPSGAGVVVVNPVEVASAALVWSPLIGALLAAAAAWYRRFLQLANPNRAPARNAKGRPNNRRR
jgi:hypothetical protein